MTQNFPQIRVQYEPQISGTQRTLSTLSCPTNRQTKTTLSRHATSQLQRIQGNEKRSQGKKRRPQGREDGDCCPASRDLGQQESAALEVCRREKTKPQGRILDPVKTPFKSEGRTKPPGISRQRPCLLVFRERKQRRSDPRMCRKNGRASEKQRVKSR